MTDYNHKSLDLHKKLAGKIEVVSKSKIDTRDELSTIYTPGVAAPCIEIAKDKSKVYDYTIKSDTIAVISDGSAVLGLGNIGAEAAIPVMEGKCALFKVFANLNAFPITLSSQDVKTTIETVRNIAPVFAGINLEDFKAPECFEIESALQDLGIPVMHDDQHGTAIVVLAGLINAIKVSKKDMNVRIVVNGAGAAGYAITRLLYDYGFKNIVCCDSKGIICIGRTDLNKYKFELASITNQNICGSLIGAMEGADVFIGVSGPNTIDEPHIKAMNKDPIVFALANPVPEIMPDIASKAGAYIVATGRSDFPNQINNVLAYPGIFKGAISVKAKQITKEMKVSAAIALANYIKNPSTELILPSVLDKNVANIVADAVIKANK